MVPIVAGALLAKRYRAEALLGRGGMGEVWRCFDVEEERDVALKAVRADFLSDPGAARLFHSEVVAVARLNHPGIIPVYDLVRDADNPALLVMAYRDGSSLGGIPVSHLHWPLISDVLIQVLEALAYAHARGVLHLDIKPENVLVERRGMEVRATLLDFGIARIRRPGRGIERWFERDAVIGTVEYMAPEQCSGTFERLGPWSDLFSVGAMAYELCSGERPFPGPSQPTAMVRRLTDPPPRLVPKALGVPPEFIDLCDTLLANEPRDRPFFAADVLQILRALSPDAAARSSMSPLPVPTVTSVAEAETAISEAMSAETMSIENLPHLLAMTGAVPSSRPPSSVSYSAISARLLEDEQAGSTELAFNADSDLELGGYGLFGLRDLPALGRTEERRAVWSAVRAMVLEQRPQVVLLEGPAGVGKSRLARDAMERAVELGLCSQMQTSWSHDGSGDEGLRGLLENLLDTRGAPAPQMRARLDFWLDRIPGVHRVFSREVELFLRPPRDAAPDAGLPLRVAMEALARASSIRPVLLWLDDVQWSRGEAEALFNALRAREPPISVCVIATVRTEEIEDIEAYEAMVKAAAAERVRVDPLDLEATRRLVRGLLDVDDELCDFLAARAEGNPLFVSQLLRQLVSAEAVERRDGRYRLTRAFDLKAVPADIRAVWNRRVDQSGARLRDLGALALVRERVSLEVAEEMGRIFAMQGRASAPSIPPPASDGRVSGSIPPSNGRAAGSIPPLSAVNGRGFGSAPSIPPPASDGRVSGSIPPGNGRVPGSIPPLSSPVSSGRGRVSAISFETSLTRALSAGLLRIEGGAYVWAHGLLREHLIKSLSPDAARELHAVAAAALSPLIDREDVQEERALHLRRAGLLREACEAMLEAGLWSFRRADMAPRRARFESLAAWAKEARFADLEARALAELGYAAAEVGEAPRAEQAIAAARQIAAQSGVSEAASWVAIRHSQLARIMGRLEEGKRATEEALALARTAGVGEVERIALLQIGTDLLRGGQIEEGRQSLQGAAAICRAAGDRISEVSALRTLAHIEDTATGLPLVERAIELSRGAGALRIELVCKQVWVDLLWRAGQRDAARREARDLSEEAARRRLRQTVSLLELQCAMWAATESDWVDVQTHRNAAARWGAASGGAVERVALSTLDVLIALVWADDVAALSAIERLERSRSGYDDASIRDLIGQAASLAPPALVDRLRTLSRPLQQDSSTA